MASSSSAAPHSALLYSLRSPTLSLAAKLALAQTAHRDTPSPVLSQVIRDWILEQQLRTRHAKDGQDSFLTDAAGWQLLAQVTDDALGVPASSPLPIFVAFFAAYPTQNATRELVGDVKACWKKLGHNALRKATLDQALEGYAVVLKSSVLVMGRGAEDADEWAQVMDSWLKGFRGVVDAGKGGKKIPSHTLANLPSLLPLLSLLPVDNVTTPTAANLRQSLLLSLQVCLFNVENLKRGIARESYNAGGSAPTLISTDHAEVGETVAASNESAEGELLNALAKAVAQGTEMEVHVQNALPLLFNLYRTSLSKNSQTLFPLPARTSFPTQSAARSAAEIHSLQKTRALSGGWIRGVEGLLAWSNAKRSHGKAKAECLWRSFEEVELGDLFRASNGTGTAESGWEGILETIVAGAIVRLNKPNVELDEREALLGLMATVMRLSFEAVEAGLGEILRILAATSASTASASKTTSDFLTALLTHHSRSLSLPALLILLSDAVASPTSVPNNLLTTHAWNAELSQSLSGMVAITVKGCWAALVAKFGTSPAVDGMDVDGAAVEGPKALGARTRLLTLLIRSLPSPVPLELCSSFIVGQVLPAVAGLVAKDSGTAGVEMLGARYAIIERLRLEGIEEQSAEWTLSPDVLDSLEGLVCSSSNGEVVAEVTRTLLQSITFVTVPAAAQRVLGAVLSRLPAGEPLAEWWNGNLEGIKIELISVALWELIARRWLPLFEHFASEAQIAQLATLVAASMSSPSGRTAGIALDSITARLLRRADFYEMRKLQAQFQQSLLKLTTIEALSPPTLVLTSLGAKKLPKPLRSLPLARYTQLVASFARITQLLPVEYLGKSLRNDLVERALGLDVWLSGRKVDLPEEEVRAAQLVLRRFVGVVKADGISAMDGVSVVEHLVKSTVDADEELASVTIRLYRNFLDTTIAAFKASPTKDASSLIAFIESHDKPLSDLAKCAKKTHGIVKMSVGELTFFELCERLTSSLGGSTFVAPKLLEAVTELSGATKPLLKTLTLTTAALEKDPSLVLEASALIDACRGVWHLREWLAVEEDQQAVDMAAFCQSTLAVLVATLSNSHAPDSKALRTCLAMLNLMSFRIARLRTVSDPKKLSTLPFETLIACHLTFRQALAVLPGATVALEDNLKRSVAAASLSEYTLALGGIAGVIASGVAGDDGLASALEMAMILIRDGPEGSSRLSSACVSEILRHLSFFLVRNSPSAAGVVPGQLPTGEQLARRYIALARFLDGICGDRPMLLSRQNVASVLALVARILLPSGTSSTDSLSPTTAETASTLYLTLISVVSHLVRHRKDHITPLFPSLISILSSFLSALRRSGFGITGSSSATVVSEDGTTTIEIVGVELGLGKRAEREARVTFPFWVWEGGAAAFEKDEAKAMGRLLAGLTTKSTATLKRKRDAPTTNIPATVPPTLASSGGAESTSLVAPLSKHAPFLFLSYLRSCVNLVSPIRSSLRAELQLGWFEIMDIMGKWEREALMQGYLRDEEEAERGVLRQLWRGWERERYRG